MVTVSETRLRQLIEASQADMPALTIEIGRVYLASEPDDAAALVLVGQAMTQLAQYADARASYERALEVGPYERKRRVLTLLGELYQAQSDLQTAEAFYRRAIEAAPEHASAHIYLGAMLAKNGRLDEAEEIHRRATLCSEGEIDEAHLNLGFVLRAKGRYMDALESFRAVLGIDPNDADAKDAILDMEQVLFRFPEA